MSSFSDAVIDALRKEAPSILSSIDEEDRQVFLVSISLLADLSLRLAAAETEEEREEARANIRHVKSTLESLKGIAKVKTYRLVMKIVGNVLSAMLKTALVAAIA